MTPAERKKAERQRKRSAGLVPLEVWVKAEDVEAVRAFVANVQKPCTNPDDVLE
jgi:hypothetical protein